MWVKNMLGKVLEGRLENFQDWPPAKFITNFV